MSKPLPRYTNTQQRDQATVDKAVGNTNPTTWTHHQANPANLRGIPCIAEGISGTQPGTNPLTETINRQHRLRRRHNS